MLARVAIAGLLGACTFHPGHAVPGDAAVLPGDAERDGALDARVWPGCMGRWHEHALKFTAPQLLVSSSTTNAIDTIYTERDPFLSHDELTMWFSSDRPGSLGGEDVWRTKRNDVTAAWGPPSVDTAASSNDGGESKVSFTSDGAYLVVSSTHAGGAGGADAWEASKTGSMFDAPEQTYLGSVNDSHDLYDPMLTPDGLHLYFASFDATGVQRIRLATRPSRTSSFGMPAVVQELDSGMNEADPTISEDELVIVFTSSRTGSLLYSNLWYATRDATDQPFGMPQPVPDINSDNGDGDPHLSPDGCRLYFSSDREGDYDLFIATVD